MQKRTGVNLGPGKYEPADRIQTISSSVNQSHHVTAIPIMGVPYPKETTVQAFGDLHMYDPTYATEKFKKDNRVIKQQ
jgi:hypothetical protein